MPRPIFLSGKVMMDDGTPPPEAVVIERVCGGNPRPEAWTDSKGHFSFQLGQNTAMMADASVGSVGGAGFPDYNSGGGMQQPGMNTGSRSMGGPSGSTMGRDLMNCDLRANLAGYRSEVVSLAGHRMFDNPDVGTIILHRLGNVEGNTISATSLAAPKDAKKAYDKGRDALKKKKPADAEKEFQKAVDAYPKYAAAWYELGMLQQDQKKFDDARKSYQQALAADAKYVQAHGAVVDAGRQGFQLAGTGGFQRPPVEARSGGFSASLFFEFGGEFQFEEFRGRREERGGGAEDGREAPQSEDRSGAGFDHDREARLSGGGRTVAQLPAIRAHGPDAAQVRLQLAELDKVTGGSAKAKEEGQQQQ